LKNQDTAIMFRPIIRSAISVNRKIVLAVGNNIKNNNNNSKFLIPAVSAVRNSSSLVEKRREDINEKALVSSAKDLLSLFDKNKEEDTTTTLLNDRNKSQDNDIVYGSGFDPTYVGKYKYKVKEAKEASNDNTITKNTTPDIQFGDPKPSSLSADALLRSLRMKRVTAITEE